MLLVLLIISLLVGIVYPSLGALSRKATGRAAHFELLGLLRQARWWSARTGRICAVHLVIDRDDCTVDVLTRDAADRPVPLPAVEEWTILEQFPRVTGLRSIPPASEETKENEMTVVFTPQGVRRDYRITLAEESATSAQIELRRPTGLVWLVRPETSASLSEKNLAAMDTYWQHHCRDAGK
jgi:Tfp pilus assembly protein FimT